MRQEQTKAFAVIAVLLATLIPIAAHATLTAVGSGNSPSSLSFNNCSGTVVCVGSTASTTSQIFIGFDGSGNSLTLDNSTSGNGITTLNANSASGAGLNIGAFGGSGTVTVDGATLSSVRLIVVGSSLSGTAGTGTLNIQNGGLVQTTGTNFGVTVGITGATGTVNVTGSGSTLSSAGRIQVGAFDNSTGSLTVSGGGTVQTTGTNFANTELEIGTGMNATGTVTVTGAGSTLTAGGIFLGGDTGSTGSLLVQNGATVTTNQVAPGVGGGLAIGGGTSATVTVTGTGSTLNIGPITAGISAGKEVLIGGFGNGSLLVDNSATVNAAGANVIVSGGVFGTQTSSPGVLTVRNGASLIANTVTINANGTLNGDGTITGDVVLNGGTISPGNSPGTLTIDGDLSLNEGTLLIEIESPSLFDILDVSGNIFVGEDLQLNLIFGFGPTGETFNIEDFFTGYSSLTFDPDFSLFENVNVSGLRAGDFVTISLGDTERTIRQASVPLPSTIALIVIGLAGLGFARRRKQ
jgi:T5SS/PEP-CTERM-associated repeat protein